MVQALDSCNGNSYTILINSQCISSPLCILHPLAAQIQSPYEFAIMANSVLVVGHIAQLPFGCQIKNTDTYHSFCSTPIYCELSMASKRALRLSLVYLSGQYNHAHHDILIK